MVHAGKLKNLSEKMKENIEKEAERKNVSADYMNGYLKAIEEILFVANVVWENCI